MEKFKYVSQLTEEDYAELFNRISLKVNLANQNVRIDYAFMGNSKRIKQSPEAKPYTTIFIEDFICRLSNAPEETKERVRQIYRNFMLERFEGTDYATEAAEYDERRQLRLEAKNSDIQL